MTRMKDLVTPDGRLKDSRINCHDVYDYLKHNRPHTEIALALLISVEEVLALIHYIVEHEEEVEANWQAFEAKAAKGDAYAARELREHATGTTARHRETPGRNYRWQRS